MNAKRLVPALLAALATYTVQNAEACTRIPHISQQARQPPMPLLNIMKRLCMDRFEPIPDAEAGVAKRIRAILQDLLDGRARAEDYTGEIWKEIKQDGVQAITEFKLLGRIGTLTLVDR